MLKISPKIAPKTKLSTTLRNWLPILQSNLETLEETLEPYCASNPFVQIRSACEERQPQKKSNNKTEHLKSSGGIIESLHVQPKSLYEILSEQINPPLFPTNKSQEIAFSIIEQINEEGYFEPCDELLQKYDANELEKIRLRFCYLEPSGIGAIDFKESFIFQLIDLDIDDELYSFVKVLIGDFERIGEYKNEPLFLSAIDVIKHFRTPPAIDFFEEQKVSIPDLFIYENADNIEIKLNDMFYPDIIIDTEGIDETHNFVAQKLKEAKDLIDALEMRKATLYKIGLMIVEYQYEYFKGGAIRPMKLKDLADELERNPSTISRAISNKYLACNRGIIPLKQFFSTAIDEDVSNSAIKEYLVSIVSKEDSTKPLSDTKLLEMIEAKFGVKIDRKSVV